MDMNSLDPSYKEASMQESYNETKRFIKELTSMDSFQTLGRVQIKLFSEVGYTALTRTPLL